MLCHLISIPGSPWRRPNADPGPDRHAEAGRFGMLLFLASLAALFAPLLIIYLLLRRQAGTWPPPGMPSLPQALWLSTLLLVVTTLLLQWAVYAVRHGDANQVRRLVCLASLFAVGFLICQTFCWWTFFQNGFAAHVWRYAGFFYFFTILHALHVIGGIVPLTMTLRRSFLGHFDRSRYHLLRYSAMYWHFLDGVWIVMFAAMMLPG